MEHLTIRKVPHSVARALEAEKKRRGTSLNQTVLDILSQGLGVEARSGRSNGLRRLAGGWSAEDLRLFEKAVAVTEQIDEELWR